MDQNTPSTDTQSPFAMPQGCNIDRRDDAQFQYDIERLLKQAEDIRISHMKRYQAQKNIGLSAGILTMLLGAGGFGWFLIMQSDPIKAFACMVLAIAIPLALNNWIKSPIEAYKADYKAQYLPQLADIMGGFQYHPHRGISETVIKKSGIAPAYDSYESEDCFRGHYKGMKVLFSEASLTTKKKEPLFRGILALIELPHDIFEGHTILTADRAMAEEHENTRWRKLSRLPLSVENKKWDRFVAFSDRPEAAQLMLGEKLLKELAEADIAFGGKNLSAVIFRKKYIFLMIPNEQDMFEVSDLHIPVSTHRHMQACKREIEQLLEVIDIFDLYRS